MEPNGNVSRNRFALNERLAREIRANRAVLEDFLRNAGIPPSEAYDFLVGAIESVSGEQWIRSKDPMTLLLQTLEARLCALGDTPTPQRFPSRKRAKPGRGNRIGRKGGG
jgi:hypothetical protein